jgi:hypothetical protein
MKISRKQLYIFILHILIITISHTYSFSLSILAAENITPHFNADSAYYFIEQQVKFGPRVPNTPPHRLCKKYLKKQLEQHGAKVLMQKFQAFSFDNKNLKLCNIIGSFNPACIQRILLAAHWDTRPFADKDTISKQTPIMGANDGASGVGILLEIARIISQMPPKNIGIDIIFFDGEDYGPPEWYKDKLTNQVSFWCLGSRFWSQHMHQQNYTANYGILLDMVGSKHATFYQEGWSSHFTPKYLARIWNIAHELGHEKYFIKQPSQHYILDDHYFVNKHAAIPMINIIDHCLAPKNCFPSYHHTHADDLNLIDKQTLKAVGETVLQAIYSTPTK